MKINQTAPAKINLCLHVVGQVPDGAARAGYHNLDSLVVFADYGDALEITPASDFSIEIDGNFGDTLVEGLDAGANNLILRAAESFAPHCAGATIRLTKNLPTCAGLGGGSADAAATLRALAQMTGADLPADSGLSLGADVPVCLNAYSGGQASRLRGVGEQISEIKLPSLPAVLVCPKASLSSAFIFQNLKNKNNAGLGTITKDLNDFDTAIEFLQQTRNDLQPVAIKHCPEIKEVLSALAHCGAAISRLSGSGPSCFGLFVSKAQAEHAAEKLAQENPQWWVKSCCLNG